MPRSNLILTLLAFSLLLAALTTGGSTHSGYLSDVVLEVLACPILLLLTWRRLAAAPQEAAPSRHAAILFTLALLSVPLLQLVPLSPSLGIWSRGALKATDGLDLLGPETGWRPLSAAPEATWLAWLSLLPAVALFWAVASSGPGPRRLFCALIILVGAVSIPLAFLQLTGGPNSDLRFYEFTNRDEAVGFFANRNHLAAYLYCASLFTGAGALALLSEVGTQTRKREQSASIFAVALAFCLVAALTAVQAMARSRAGVLLQGLALISLIALAPPALSTGQARSHIRKILVLVAFLSAAAIGQLLLYRFVDRFAYESVQADARLKFLANTLAAARTYLPFGSGLGTFVRVYGTFEKPADTLAERFANHAHNDWAELWLETGVAGLLLAALFVGWVVVKAIGMRNPPPVDEPAVDTLFRRAGLVAIVLLLLHSFVDYPIRTEAIMAVFAVAAGLQMSPPEAARRDTNSAPLTWVFRRRHQHKYRDDEPADIGADVPSPQTPSGASAEVPRSVHAESSKRWETAAPWPDQWRATKQATAVPQDAPARAVVWPPAAPTTSKTAKDEPDDT